jgi:PIN domain nuclease of toxin-antitoxin system
LSRVPPLLLDTCAVIWLVNSEPAAQALSVLLGAEFAEGRPTFVSPISAWEIGLLVRLGRLRLPARPEVVFEQIQSAAGISVAAMTPNLLIASSGLPGDLHRDPADRIIIATAREYGFRVVTRDRKILDYAEMGHVMALEC